MSPDVVLPKPVGVVLSDWIDGQMERVWAKVIKPGIWFEQMQLSCINRSVRMRLR
jgi:hypothetical protein